MPRFSYPMDLYEDAAWVLPTKKEEEDWRDMLEVELWVSPITRNNQAIGSRIQVSIGCHTAHRIGVMQNTKQRKNSPRKLWFYRGAMLDHFAVVEKQIRGHGLGIYVENAKLDTIHAPSSAGRLLFTIDDHFLIPDRPWHEDVRFDVVTQGEGAGAIPVLYVRVPMVSQEREFAGIRARRTGWVERRRTTQGRWDLSEHADASGSIKFRDRTGWGKGGYRKNAPKGEEKEGEPA